MYIFYVTTYMYVHVYRLGKKWYDGPLPKDDGTSVHSASLKRAYVVQYVQVKA